MPTPQAHTTPGPAKNQEQTIQAFEQFLAAYMNPAFGALPKQELELLVLKLLIELGRISARPSVYELVTQLRITRAKARRLIYDFELRTSSPAQLDADLKQLLRRPLVQKRGDAFLLEVENPLLSDHIRARLQSLGHVSDGTFSPQLITLTLDGMVALIEEQLDEAGRSLALAALRKAGAPEKSLKAVLKSALKKLGEKLADEAGAAVAEHAGDYLEPLLDASRERIQSAFQKLFSKPAA